MIGKTGGSCPMQLPEGTGRIAGLLHVGFPNAPASTSAQWICSEMYRPAIPPMTTATTLANVFTSIRC